MTTNKNLVLLRLAKEEKQLREDPLQNAWVARQGVLNFHFCLHDLQSPYQNGFYHGVLKLSEDYPFAPPVLIFFTPSGRFQTNKQICTTFTNFHKESWTSSWNVRTMIMGTISFMYNQAEGSVGSLNKSSFERSRLAQQSMSFNLDNAQFKQLFHKEISGARYSLRSRTNKAQGDMQPRGSGGDSKWKLYCLYGLVGLLILLWIKLKTAEVETF